RPELFALAGGGELLERGVGTLHVRRVVLVVVELEDLRGVVRLECRVVVGQVGKRVLGHRSSLGSGRGLLGPLVVSVGPATGLPPAGIPKPSWSGGPPLPAAVGDD